MSTVVTVPTDSLIFQEVAQENLRQDSLWGANRSKPDGTGPQYRDDAEAARTACDQASPATWRHILIEEVYEAIAEDDLELLREELIQVMAVAAAWISDIDNR